MIRHFKHRGLRKLYEEDSPRGLRADQADKVARILARLDEATEVAHVDLPGFRLHPLKGNLKGFWSLSVSGNWRIVFRFQDGHVTDVDLVDYH